MHRNVHTLYFLLLTLAGLTGCSSEPSSKASGKPVVAPDKIHGKVQVAQNETTAIDAALNADGPSVYLVDGINRYRLFFKKAIQVDPGKEYVAEGVNAQKMIDEIGDPDQGKNGYPLDASCNRVVRTAWPELDFAVVDSDVTTLHNRVKRYPARPVFLVTQLTPVTSTDKGAASAASKDDEDLPEINVPADKQRALLISAPSALTAPLWEPTADTIHCKVSITDGKVSELDTGAELCEAVAWSQFRYQPTLKAGHPVKVKTEVEVHFQPRK